jgi:hypothetical protein
LGQRPATPCRSKKSPTRNSVDGAAKK